MTTSSSVISIKSAKKLQSKQDEYPAGTIRFDLMVAILGTFMAVGAYIDGWAHNNIDGLFETFFTPYHAALYGGYLLAAISLTVTHTRNMLRGYAWSKALPRGYFASFIGIVLFGLGGFADMLWHETFGFEEDLEALLSPSHLILGAGAFLYVTGPLRSAWYRKENSGTWATMFPVILSATLGLSLITFFVQYATLARPGDFIDTPTSRQLADYQSVSAIFDLILTASLVMGISLFVMRRWKLPFGAFTFIIGINHLLMFFMLFRHAIEAPFMIAAMITTGLIADLLYQRFQPSLQNQTALRHFAFWVPFIMIGLYMASLIVNNSLWWAIHMWAGAPVVAGVTGLLMSFLVFPPEIETEQVAGE